MLPRLVSILKTTGIAVLIGYAIVVAAGALFQRQLMYFPDPRPSRPDVPGVQVVQLVTRDGERLVAWYLPPTGDRPVLLHLNGNGGGLSTQYWRWTRIAGEGVGFLAVAYRGYAGSTGHPTERGLRQDSEAAYGFLAARYPAQRIVIHGYSLGSGLAVRLAAEHPARALVLEAPYTSVEALAEQRFPLLPVRWVLLDRYRSRDLIGKVHMPVLIVHGDRDSVIPFAMGKALYALANAPKTFVAIPGGDHNTLVRDGLYDHVWSFLGLEPPAPEAPPLRR